MAVRVTFKVVEQNNTVTSPHSKQLRSVIQVLLNKSPCFNQSMSLLTTILKETDELIGRNPDSLAKPLSIAGHHKQQGRAENCQRSVIQLYRSTA